MHGKVGIRLAFIATVVQYYDYALFGISAAALADAYIPYVAHEQKFLGFFAIISGAVIARPIGSLIFGYIGDKYNRALVLKISVCCASIATILIGTLPIGPSNCSMILLLIARMIFMISMAGEGDGVRIYVAETISSKKEFLGNGFVTFSSQIGVLIASIAWYLASHGAMPEYLWRINFIFGGLCGVVIFFLRRHFVNALYAPQQHLHQTQSATYNTLTFVCATLIAGSIGGMYHFQIIFCGTFLAKMAQILSVHDAAILTIISTILYAITAVISGYTADKYSPVKQIYACLFLTIILVIVIILDTRNTYLAPCVISITALIPFYSVPLQIILKRTMPAQHLLKTFSLSHSLGSALLSASVPTIASFMWYYTEKIYAPFLYIIVLSAILLISYQITQPSQPS